MSMSEPKPRRGHTYIRIYVRCEDGEKLAIRSRKPCTKWRGSEDCWERVREENPSKFPSTPSWVREPRRSLGYLSLYVDAEPCILHINV